MSQESLVDIQNVVVGTEYDRDIRKDEYLAFRDKLEPILDSRLVLKLEISILEIKCYHKDLKLIVAKL